MIGPSPVAAKCGTLIWPHLVWVFLLAAWSCWPGDDGVVERHKFLARVMLMWVRDEVLVAPSHRWKD